MEGSHVIAARAKHEDMRLRAAFVNEQRRPMSLCHASSSAGIETTSAPVEREVGVLEDAQRVVIPSRCSEAWMPATSRRGVAERLLNRQQHGHKRNKSRRIANLLKFAVTLPL